MREGCREEPSRERLFSTLPAGCFPTAPPPIAAVRTGVGVGAAGLWVPTSTVAVRPESGWMVSEYEDIGGPGEVTAKRQRGSGVTATGDGGAPWPGREARVTVGRAGALTWWPCVTARRDADTNGMWRCQPAHPYVPASTPPRRP